MQIDHRCESAEATTSLTRKSRATAGEGERGKHRKLFHKSNVRIATDSGWLQRLDDM